MSAFRDQDVAVEARIQQVLDEIGILRERLAAFEGENRDAVIASQLDQLRARVVELRAKRDGLRFELKFAREGEGESDW